MPQIAAAHPDASPLPPTTQLPSGTPYPPSPPVSPQLSDAQDATGRGIYVTLKAHTDAVNAIKWVPRRTRGDEVLVSASVDETVRIWTERNHDNGNSEFVLSQTLTEHSGSVNCVAVLPDLIASGASDGIVNIYAASDQWTLQQTLRLTPVYPLVLALHKTENGIILAVGGSSSSVHLFTTPLQTVQFTRGPVLKGHEDWIRGLAFASTETDIFLASASQDRYLRLWRITKQSTTTSNLNDTDALLTAALGGESYPLTLSDSPYTITFSALLPGHDDWVFTVTFHPSDPECLLSASADASLIIWRPEASSGIWIPETRLGEVSSLKGATTAQGSSGGFWGAVWCAQDRVASWGKTGGWRVWSRTDGGKWVQEGAVAGAVRAVKGISWDPEGMVLLSVSLDQTTRMFGEWKHKDTITWHELARPQIHGYDLNAISVYHNWKFVSGADEKVLRVFQASKPTADLVARLADLTLDTTNLPSAANLPVLSLSNKAESTEHEFLSPSTIPPLEDHLARYTLSPELEKIYAHPSELLAITTSHSGSLIVSTCKSSTPENAVIRVHTTDARGAGYAEIATLKGHSLSVVRMTFSGDDQVLVSVGRDRSWCAFDMNTFETLWVQHKAHARIIWDVSFAPSDFSVERVFATASRDKTVKIWHGNEKTWKCVCTVKFAEAVTACAFVPEMVGESAVLAVGLENGRMYILSCLVGGTEFRVLHAFDERITHAEAVNALGWRSGGGVDGRWEVASCGDDCSVRIYTVHFGTHGNGEGKH